MGKHYAKTIIALAKKQVGYLEKKSNKNLDSMTGNAGANNYTKYARDLDKIKFYNGAKNGYPWCDVFYDWLFVKAFGEKAAKELLCQPDRSLGAGCGYSMDYYRKKNRFHAKPKAGDQIFFYNSSMNSIAHTGLVYKVTDTYVHTIEGNTSSASGVVANGGAVAKKKYARRYSRIAGYGRPAYDTEPKDEKKAEKTEAKAAKKQAAKKYTGKLPTRTVGVAYKRPVHAKRWQKFLNWAIGAGLNVDGVFGTETAKGTKRFQKLAGLAKDGIVGKKTRKAAKAYRK